MDLLILSIIPTNGAKEGEKLAEGDKNGGRGVEKKGKAVKRKRRIEFGWQESPRVRRVSHLCSAAWLHDLLQFPYVGLLCPGCTGPGQKGGEGKLNCKMSN